MPGPSPGTPSRRVDEVACPDALGRGGRRPACHEPMNPAELRDHCLSFAGAEETFPFGAETSVFKVGGRMFALAALDTDSLQVSLKCEPQLAEALRASYPAVLPGYHLNKRHWNTVNIDGSLPERMVKDLIEDSYDLVVAQLSATRRRGLGSRPDGHAT